MDRSSIARLGFLFAASLAAGSAAADSPDDIRINEVRIDQTGPDDDEYFELSGPPGAPLAGLAYLVIGDGTTAQGSGVIEAVVPLGARVVAADGFFLVTETSFGIGAPDLTVGASGLNFENDDNVTHLLVRGFTGTNGQDLDTNDDGVLDLAPWSAVLDSVALVKSATSTGTEHFYAAAAVGPDGGFVPAHAFRAPDHTGAWRVGSFDGDADTPGATNPPGPIPDVPIPAIQGAGHVSPHAGRTVRTHGIVTARDRVGYWLQDAAGDGDPATSDAVFVFTGGAPAVAVGDDVEIDGVVSEYVPAGSPGQNLATTQITSQRTTVRSRGNLLPQPVLLGPGGRSPPNEVIDDDGLSTYDPVHDGIDFFESLESMLVRIPSPAVIAPTNAFAETWVLAAGGAGATGRNARGGITVTAADLNPERIQVQTGAEGLLPLFHPEAQVGDRLADVTGVVSYAFGNFEVLATQAFGVHPGGLAQEATLLTAGPDALTVAGANVLNLDPNDDDGDADLAGGRFERTAGVLVHSLRAPDVVALQEVQDDSGADDDGTVSAALTLATLCDAILAAGGPAYDFADAPPADGRDGGEPGGNIRVAFLFNPARVALATGSLRRITDPDLSDGDAFEDCRKPLAADFLFRGRRVTVIGVHLSSRGGGTPLYGARQPPSTGNRDRRTAQAAIVRRAVTSLLAARPDANVVVAGDMNDLDFEPACVLLAGSGVTALLDLVTTLPEPERYSYVFDGNAQALDHVFVGPSLAGSAQYDIVHVNAEFADAASDHDPDVAWLRLPPVADADRDGLSDAQEQAIGTNPASKDTDLDGAEDGVEVALGTSPLAPSALRDTDADGIPDAFDTSPNAADCDADGVRDGWEIAKNGNLRDPVALGDADGSGGRPNAADAQLLLRIVLGQAPVPPGVSVADLDVNRDGLLDRRDATLLAYFTLGRVPCLPQP